GQSFNVVVQHVNPGRYEEAGLPHTASECLAHSSCLVNEIAVAHEKASNRTAEALAETDRYGMKILSVVEGILFLSNDCVEESRSIEVKCEPAFPAHFTNLPDLIHLVAA